MTQDNRGENANRPRIIDRHLPPAEPKRGGPLGIIEGTDSAALGLDPQPASAPPGAKVDSSMTQMPGPKFGDHPATEDKPWATSFGTESDEAGIGAEPDPEGQI
jgi:hypothetical protein